MALVETAAGRDARGRWQPGQSGNPAGKLPGTRNRATVIREFLQDGEDAAAVRSIIELAKAGHWAAARYVVDAIAPKPRGRLVDLELPVDIDPVDHVGEAVNQVVRLMAGGEISVDEAQALIKTLRDSRTQPDDGPAVAAVSPDAPRGAVAPPASDLHLQARAGVTPAASRGAAKPPPSRLAAALRGSTSLTRPPASHPPPA